MPDTITLQVAGQYSAIFLFGAHTGPWLVVNGDTQNTIYVGDSPSVNANNLSESVPIQPGGAIAFLASREQDTYINGTPGAVVNVYVIPGASQYFQPISDLILQGLNPGIFIYRPKAGLGNLVGSWAQAASVDQYGNPYPSGIDVFGGQISGVSFINGIIQSGSQYSPAIYAPTVGTPAITGGNSVEMNVIFDQTAGTLTSYASTQTTVTLTGTNGQWSVPAGVTSANVKCTGGSNGGQYGSGSVGGSGGGGGEYAAEPNYNLAGKTSVPYVIGQGGTGATASPGNYGGEGGITSFDGPGVVAHGSIRNVGGTGSVNTIHFNGGNGGTASSTGGGGGGGPATGAGAGANGTNSSTSTGGAGGSGGGGAGGNNGVSGSAGATGGGGGGAGAGAPPSSTINAQTGPTSPIHPAYGTSTATSTAFNVSAGDIVVVMTSQVVYASASQSPVTVKDSLGNTYAQATGKGNLLNSLSCGINTFYYTGAHTGITITGTSQYPTTCFWAMSIERLSGASSTLGATATNNGTSSPMGTSITTTKTGSYVYTSTAGLPTNPSAYPTFTLESGESNYESLNDTTSGIDQGTCYQQRTTSATGTPGALQTGWTYTTNPMAEWVACSLEIIPAPSSVYSTTTFVPIATYSYYGNDATGNPANGLRDTNGILYQGEDTNGVLYGNQYSFSYIGNISSTLAGATVDTIELVTSVEVVNNTIGYEVIGYSTESSFGSTGTLVGATQATNVAAVATGTNYVDVTSTFTAGWQAGTDVSILFGPGPNTNPEYWAELQGGAGSSAGPYLTVYYHTDGTAPSGGSGAAGSISVTYLTPGSSTLNSTIAPVAGTDQYGNAYPPGIAGIQQAVNYARLTNTGTLGFGALPYTADDIVFSRAAAGSLIIAGGAVSTSAVLAGSLWRGGSSTAVDATPSAGYGWTNITPASNWTNRGAGFPLLQCRKLASPPNGVQIMGEVIWTSTGSAMVSGVTIGTMTSSFYPNTERLLYCVISSVTGTFTVASPAQPALNVTTAGVIKLFNVTGGGTSGNTLLLQLWGVYSMDGN
jgi:hypothetical protein